MLLSSAFENDVAIVLPLPRPWETSSWNSSACVRTLESRPSSSAVGHISRLSAAEPLAVTPELPLAFAPTAHTSDSTATAKPILSFMMYWKGAAATAAPNHCTNDRSFDQRQQRHILSAGLPNS